VAHRQDERALHLVVIAHADSADAARAYALQLVESALEDVGLGRLARKIEIGAIASRPALPGRPRLVAAAPPRDPRRARLPDGRVVCAVAEGPAGDWFAYVEGESERVVCGRILADVVDELLELPFRARGQWFDDVLAELAGHRTPAGVRYPCPCCDHLTLQEPPGGSYDICPVCFWEDDGVQLSDPRYEGGANGVSLEEARENYRRFGACEERVLPYVRPPADGEQP
jgi:hypothetical protein